MDSSSNHIFHSQNSQNTSELLRFRSAPSSLLANLTENGVNIGSVLNYHESDKSIARAREAAAKFSSSPQSYSGLPPHYPNQILTKSDSSYGVGVSMAMSQQEHMRIVDSSLSRQSSSPAGLFGNLSVQNGHANTKSGNCGGANGTNGQASPRLKSQLSFPSRGPSSLGMLSQISEIGSESIAAGSPDSGKFRNSNSDTRFYSSPGFQYSSWGDSPLGENFNGWKRDQENIQVGELGNGFHVLSRHLSLPKTAAEMGSMGKLLHFQDSIPCKTRAKRGCATHPRSIAERVRRTRISERMRKLQDLVPNMEKQTNTADMLDLAVDYIKDLQKQYKTLSDKRAKCKCLSKQKPTQNQVV